jgi:hypothetical protein
MGFQVGQGSAATHVALAVSELFQGFVFEAESTSGGPAAYHRINVFPKRKAIYIVNVCSFFSFLFFLLPRVVCLFPGFYMSLKMLITFLILTI